MIEMYRQRLKSWIVVAFAGTLGLTGCHKAAMPNATTAPVPAVAAGDLYLAGAADYQNGDKDKAVDELVISVHQNPDAVMPRQLLAKIYLEKNDYAKAADQFQALTKLDPYTEPNFYQLGYCQQLLNQLSQAVISYQQALQLDPRDAKAATNLGVVYLSLNRIDDAVKSLDVATQLDDKSWYAWASFGIALDAHGQARDAEQAFRRSLELDVSQTSTIYNLGSNLLSQGRASEAVPVLQELVKHDDSIRSHKKLAEAFVASHDLAGATAEYRKLVQLDPRNYQMINALAFVLIDRYEKEAEFDDNKKTEAVSLWRQSLALSPNQEDVKALLKKWGGK
jgi:Flp pilus assembly protein TadD